MSLNSQIDAVTSRIRKRSEQSRAAYLDLMRKAASAPPRRTHLSCSGQAHAYAAMGAQKDKLAEGKVPNIGIITAYNDMLSAHQPFETYPSLIRKAAQDVGATAQVAGGVPAMCDGITQGETGMELSLFSRDVIALAASVGLSHNVYDAVAYLGVCDKIIPGLVMAAATFGYMPSVFLPAGPMDSGLPNDEKAAVRKRFATGDATREELMASEMASYHGPGTCTFYGTANTNQMLMEFMGLHLPGASFVNPGTPLRDALTIAGTQRAVQITQQGNAFTPVCDVLDEKAFVNGIVGLMATGGSTNLILHLPAMAKAAGIVLDLEDFDDLSRIVPLMAKVYPNGLADVNHFHAAGGLQFLIGNLLDAGLLHQDVVTVAGLGLDAYRQEPVLRGTDIEYRDGPTTPLNDKIVRPALDPFQKTGGLVQLSGNLGRGVMKVSAVKPENQVVKAPARVFHSQEAVKAAFQANEFTADTVIVVRFQGPMSNGMPELHGLTPTLTVLQDRGLNVALVTDGRMSGASGKVPAAIHVCPEAADGGAIGKIRDGDIVHVDGQTGTLELCGVDLADRASADADLSGNGNGVGRELFEVFRRNVGRATEGAAVVL